MNIFGNSILRKLSQLSLNNVRTIDAKLRPLTLPPLFPKTFSNKPSPEPTPYEVIDVKSEQKLVKQITEKVNNLVSSKKEGRLYAVVHVAGKQVKVTEGDVIIVEGYWPPDVGDRISLDKVLMVGAVDFTLVGRPLVQKGLVKVEGTVIEKTLSHTKTHFRKKRRKQYMRIHFYRIPQTYLRINDVRIEGEVNNPPKVQGLETAIF